MNETQEYPALASFINDGFRELGAANISFGLKLLALFGFFYLLQMLAKTGFNFFEIFVYIIAFFKWLYYKVKGKDV